MQGTYVAPFTAWIVFAMVVAYNGAILSLAFYLQSHHPEVWSSFNSDWFPGSSQFSYRFVRTGFYAVFQSKYQRLHDERVRLHVLAIRVLLVATIIGIVFLKWFGYWGQQSKLS